VYFQPQSSDRLLRAFQESQAPNKHPAENINAAVISVPMNVSSIKPPFQRFLVRLITPYINLIERNALKSRLSLDNFKLTALKANTLRNRQARAMLKITNGSLTDHGKAPNVNTFPAYVTAAPWLSGFRFVDVL